MIVGVIGYCNQCQVNWGLGSIHWNWQHRGHWCHRAVSVEWPDWFGLRNEWEVRKWYKHRNSQKLGYKGEGRKGGSWREVKYKGKFLMMGRSWTCLNADIKKPEERLKIQQKVEIVNYMRFLRKWIGIESRIPMKQFDLYRRKNTSLTVVKQKEE